MAVVQCGSICDWTISKILSTYGILTLGFRVEPFVYLHHVKHLRAVGILLKGSSSIRVIDFVMLVWCLLLLL